MIDDVEIKEQVESYYKQIVDVKNANALGKMSKSDCDTAIETIECLIDAARANYIIAGFNYNYQSDYLLNKNQQEFNKYVLYDDSGEDNVVPFLPFNGIIKYSSYDYNRIALIVVQKIITYCDFTMIDSYGTYDSSTLEGVIEAKSEYFLLTKDNPDCIDSDVMLTLMTKAPKNEKQEIDTSFWKYVRQMRVYHNTVEAATTAKLVSGSTSIVLPTDENSIKFNEVTVHGGGVISKLTNYEKLTHGYADILLQYKKPDGNYSRVWEVKSDGVKESVAVSQLQRYLDASKKIEQDFYVPLREGYVVGNFIIPGPNNKYIVVYSNERGKISEDYASGNGVVKYNVCDSLSDAKAYAFDVCREEVKVESLEYQPIYEPNFVYEITPIDLTAVGNVVIGIVIIGGIVYFAAPAAGAAGGGYVLYQALQYA